MDNPHGYSWKGCISRINLSEELHKRLHSEIILAILNNYSISTKNYKHEHYIWKNYIKEIDKKKIIEEVVKATLKFKKENGNSIQEF